MTDTTTPTSVPATLTQAGHVGQLYELTGPRLLTPAQGVEVIAEGTGREMRYLPVSIDEYAAAGGVWDLPAATGPAR
jgi:uncharacterized protein YbjT (DUF2867 family)